MPTRQLNRIFIIQIALFIFSIMIVSIFVTVIVVMERNERDSISEFKADLLIHAAEINYEILIIEEYVKAVSSRSMIKQKLYDYYTGHAALDELKKYTQPKYAEGAAVYKNLVYAFRTAADGSVIAGYFVSSPGPELDSAAGLKIFTRDNRTYTLIRNPIIHNGIEIGTDTGAFLLNEPAYDATHILQNVKIVDYEEGSNEIYKYSATAPVGETGYYLYAELNQQSWREGIKSVIKPVVIQAVLLFAVVILISYFTILKLVLGLSSKLKSANVELETALSEKDLLLRELQHRIKNNLAFIISYVTLQQTGSDGEELVQRNRKLISKIEAISTAYEMLQTEAAYSKLNLGDYLKKLCDTVVDSSDVPGVLIEDLFEKDLICDSKTAITIGLIYSELIVNSIKHAKIKDLELLITAGLTLGTDKLVCLIYEDNGKPYPADFDLHKSSSMGMLVITSLSDQIGAKMQFDFSVSKRILFLLDIEKMNSDDYI